MKLSAVRFPLLLFLVLWLGIWGWMRLVIGIYPSLLTPDPVLRPYYVTPVKNAWLAVWQRWDAPHYQAIAERGYEAFPTALFTPPLYPFLMRLLSPFFGGTLLAGIFVAAIAYAIGLVLFYQLARLELSQEQAARRALIYLMLFPTAFFFFAPYTESLFLLGSVGAMLALRRKEWLRAGLWGSLAAASRLPGALIVIPLSWAAFGERNDGQTLRRGMSVLLPLLAALSFPFFAWLGLGKSFWAPFQAQSARFHGTFTWPGWNILVTVSQIFSGEYPLPNFVDLVFTILFVAYAVPVWKRLPRVYGIYYLSFLALYLTRIAAVYPLLSMPRYVLSLFPAFFVMAQQGSNLRIHRLILYAFSTMLLFFSGQFAIWGWVG
ncbi:MAG: mannosyltransferase family protein [Anaerolineales bacterium]